MILRQALCWATDALNAHDIEDSHLEAEVLLKHTLNLSPAQLYAQPRQNLSSEEVDRLQQVIERRRLREPTAYITKHREFYGFDFYVDSRVLIPRPETELLVDEAIKYTTEHASYPLTPGNNFTIADIGTGCGSIAISLAMHLPQAKIYAIDISSPALEVAKINCLHHNVTKQVILLQGNLIEPLPEPVNLIVANLPYIKDSELPKLTPEIAKFEPRIALAGGQDGLGKIRKLLIQAREKLQPPCCLLLEIGETQNKMIAPLTDSCLSNAKVELIADLSGIERAAKISLNANAQY